MLILFSGNVVIPANVAIAILAAIASVFFIMLWGKVKEGTMYYKFMMAAMILLVWSGFFWIVKAIWPVE